MRILYVFAHPDDESFGPARAISKQRRQGHEVYLLTLTRGGATRLRHKFGYSVDEMGEAKTFRGYDDGGIGYEFLREAINRGDFNARGVELDNDEIFISDGAKCDTGNMQEIFGADNTIAVTDPVYPVYVDTNVMAGRTGAANEKGQYGKIVYMPCTAENNFIPEVPAEPVDIIYLCFKF